MKGSGQMVMRIGILGGTFDPIHRIHLEMARQALRQFELHEVWLMPSGNPPHKKGKPITPEHERLRMVELAVEGEEGLVASGYELERRGYIYTSDTLSGLHSLHPDTEWYFILGGDSLLYLDAWHEPGQILDLAVILVAVRGGETPEELLKKRDLLCLKFPQARIQFLQMEADPLSSTQIREAFERDDFHFLAQALPAPVYQYATRNGLYR